MLTPPLPTHRPHKLTLDVEPRYIIGFPIVIGLVYQNTSKNEGGLNLPTTPVWGVFRPHIGIHLHPAQGGVEVHMPPKVPGEYDRGETFGLSPGESRRELFDLTRLGVVFQPGIYTLSLRIKSEWNVDELESGTVRIELVAPSAADAKEAERLRNLGDPEEAKVGRWRSFLTSYSGNVTLSPNLSTEARQQFAFFLFLHHAYFGPDSAATIDPHLLDAIVTPSLQPEIAALRLELATARGDPSAAQLRQDMISRWPGMRWRADAIPSGRGLITEYRNALGAGSPFVIAPQGKP